MLKRCIRMTVILWRRKNPRGDESKRFTDMQILLFQPGVCWLNKTAFRFDVNQHSSCIYLCTCQLRNSTAMMLLGAALSTCTSKVSARGLQNVIPNYLRVKNNSTRSLQCKITKKFLNEFHSIGLPSPPVEGLLSLCAISLLHKDKQLGELAIKELRKYESHPEFGHHVAFLIAQFFIQQVRTENLRFPLKV